MTDLSITIAGVKFNNPVIPASGTFEVLGNRDSFFSPSLLGALINKTVFLDPRPGNPPPRLFETPCGMLNSIGLPGEGVDLFIKDKLPKMRELGPPVIVSIAEHSVESFCLLSEKIEKTGMADLLELDLSCPNIEKGTQWATDPVALSSVLKAVSQAVKLPVIAKLSPSVTDISEMAVVAEEAGAKALSMVNTFRGMVIDINRKKPLLGAVTGGLSGPAIRPLAIFAVYSCFKRVSIPIIGIGGIAGWQDAVEFLLAGAKAVGVGMQNFANPMVMKQTIEGIENYLKRNNYTSVNDIIGLAHQPA